MVKSRNTYTVPGIHGIQTNLELLLNSVPAFQMVLMLTFFNPIPLSFYNSAIRVSDSLALPAVKPSFVGWGGRDDGSRFLSLGLDKKHAQD